MRKGLWIVAGMALLGSSMDVLPRIKVRGAIQRPNGGRQETDGRRHHAPTPERPPHIGKRPAHRFLSGGGWHRSIRGPAFRFPQGFTYQTWATGGILPPVFLSASYFYDGYATLGLAPPPGGYQWVRYGPDLLLVNVHTGRIADGVADGCSTESRTRTARVRRRITWGGGTRPPAARRAG